MKKKYTKIFIFISIAGMIFTSMYQKKKADDSAKATKIEIVEIYPSEVPPASPKSITTEENKLVCKIQKLDEIESNNIYQGLNIEFLNQFNQKTIGAIAIPGTNIYYPICDSENDEEWLNTNYAGKQSIYGTIFLDYINSGFDDKISILYGHNMKNGSMFAGINKYSDPQYYQNHDYLFLSLENKIVVYKFFASVKVLSTDNKYRISNFDEDYEFENYILNVVNNASVCRENYQNLEYKNLLQLITCNGNKKIRTAVYFTKYFETLNPFISENLTEQKTQDIVNLTNEKSGYFKLFKSANLFTLNKNANCFEIIDKNDNKIIWFLKELSNIQRETIEKSGLLDERTMVISGEGEYCLFGVKYIIQNTTQGIVVICEEGSIKNIFQNKVTFSEEKYLFSKNSLVLKKN